MPRLLLPFYLTRLAVCHNAPISRSKVIQGLGQRGRWFFGFKLHLPMNHQGRIMALKITGGTTDDRQCWST